MKKIYILPKKSMFFLYKQIKKFDDYLPRTLEVKSLLNKIVFML